MIFSYFPFLFVLFLIVNTSSQLLPSSSFCLGNCATCDPLVLTKCTLPYPCDWNFYNEKDDNNCILAPSTELVLQELGHSSTKMPQNSSKAQSQSKKQSYCQYISSEGKKYIQILGLYSGTQAIEKTFQVDPLSDTYELTFDLLHTAWLPFNDFLLVDLMSQKENILNLEISFDQRMSVETQIAVITCNGVRVMTKKYSIKFANYNRVKNQLNAVFTSFLQNAMWGITNLRMQQGCLGYSVFNPKTQKCNKCDSDAYAVIKQNADWCEKCPQLCKTCQSKTKCLVCVQGAILNRTGLCDFGDKYKTQVALLGQKVETCDGQLIMGSSSSKVTISEFKNDEELLYDEIQLGFNLYYAPSSWKSSTKSYLSIKLNKIQVMKLDYKNMTNLGVTRCLAFKDKRAAKIEIFSSKIVHNDNSAIIELELVGNQKGIQLGIGAVRVISLIKKKPAPTAITVPVLETKAESIANSSTISSKSETQDVDTKINNTNSNNQTKTVPQLPKTIEIKTIPSIPQPTKTTEIKTMPQPNKATQNQTTPQPPQKIENIKTNILPQPPEIAPQTQKNVSKIIITTPVFPTGQPNNQKPTNEASKSTQSIPPPPIISPSNISVSKFLQNIIANAEPNKSISFITTSSNDQSGIEIHVSGQFFNSTATYYIYINKLDSSQYKLNSFKVEDRKLRLFVKIDQSFTDANVAIYSLATSRLLVAGTPQLVGTLKIDRFDALTQSQISSLQAFSIIFSITAQFAVILIFLVVLLGKGIIVQQLITSLQIIFLHVYIGSEYLPLTFRDVIGALNITKNLNFFTPSHRTNIEANWIGESTHSCPARFYLFDSQVYFLREFYPIIFVNIIYLIWFGCLYYARKRYNRELIDQEKYLHHRTIDNLVGRAINFLDQIWRYQFLATIWICFQQFYDISSPHGGAAFNGILCILAFICSVSWPIFVTIYCRRQYYQCEYSEYLYFYEDIYYCKIPQYQLPSPHHRVGYPIMKTAKLFLIALVICYFGPYPLFSLFTLITIQAAEVLYSKIYDMFIDKRYWTLRIIQNGLFVIIDFVLLVMLLCDKMASSIIYKSMGYVLSGLAFLILINSAIRMGYLAHKKFKQMCVNDEQQNYQLKKPKTKRVV